MQRSHRPRFRFSWFAPRYWLSWCRLGALALSAWLPPFVRARLGDALAFAMVRTKRRRIIVANLALCYPGLDAPARDALLARHARIACRVLLEIGPLMFRSRRYLIERVDLRGAEHLRPDGRYIFLSPHCSALEHCGLRLCLERRMLTMVRVHDDPVADWAVTRMRTRYRALVFRHDADLLSLVRAVRQGHGFYYLPDEVQRRSEARGEIVFAPFFGVQKATVTALGRLARLTDALVVPTRSAFSPETGRFALHLEQPIADFGSGDAERDARRTNELLERLVRAEPEQFAWTQKIFRVRPAGSPPAY